MKSTTITILAIIMFLASVSLVSANDIIFEVNQMQPCALNKDGITVQQDLPQLRLKIGWQDVYLVGSYEQATIYYIGQESLNLDIYGLAVGYKHKINKKFSVSLDGGYYLSQVGYPSSGNDGQEGHWLYMNHEVWPLPPQNRWESYKTEISGAIGITLGATYQFSKYAAIQGGYRFLHFDMNVYGWDGPFEEKGHPQGYWTLRESLNMSGYFVGISASF